jgi:uncharacterized protein (DUF58 family)
VSEGEPSAAAPAPPEVSEDLLDPDFMRRLDQLVLLSRKVFRGRMKGERRSRKKGVSVEFADYRDYVPGDDLRFIDWNIFGRLDRLFLKLFMEEEDLFIHILIDTSRSMDFGVPAKLTVARQVAAALGYIGLTSLDRVGLGAVAGGDSVTYPPTRGRGQIWKLISFLQDVTADGATDLAESARRYFLRNRARGIAILITDFLDPVGHEAVLKQLLYHDLDTHVIHVLSEEEISPPLAGDLRLVDVETAEATDITANEQLLATYRNNLNSFIGRVKRYATDRGITYTFAPNTMRFEELVLGSLRRGGLIH